MFKYLRHSVLLPSPIVRFLDSTCKNKAADTAELSGSAYKVCGIVDGDDGGDFGLGQVIQ